jgi:serine/threonine protein kinase
MCKAVNRAVDLCSSRQPAYNRYVQKDPSKSTSEENAVDPMVGTVIANKYEVISLVGRGGMSQVYKARNKQVGSIVAIKTLKQDLMSDEELFARFCREAKAVQTLTHPNIVTMHEFGVTLEGQPFMAMDYLEGQTLGDIIEDSERIGVKRLLRIFTQVCDALGHAHAHKIIHRDIKPGNIMVVNTANETDVVKIFDFGFAKLLEKPGRKVQALTQLGDVLGTPLYMSPEQSAGKTLDSRSDIYAVGCVMYEALTGRAPLIGDNVLDTMQKQINEKPVALDTVRPDLFIPEPMQAILFKTLEKDPANRYQSMTDLKRDLEVLLSGMSGRAGAVNVKQGDLPGLSKMKLYPEEKKMPLAVVIPAVVLILTAICGTGFAIAHFIQTKAEERAALEREQQAEAMPEQTVAPPPQVVKKKMPPLPADPKKATPILIAFAKDARGSGQLIDADKAVTKAMSLLRSTGHSNDLPISEAFALSGNIYLDMQNFKKADSMLQKALAIQQRELGPSSPTVIDTLNALGRAAEGQQDFARADAYFKQALALKR